MDIPIGKISLLLGMGFLWGRSVGAFSPTFCVAELRSPDRGSKINFRSGAGLDQTVMGTGQSGDLVYLVSQFPPEPDIKIDRSGQQWYRVQLPRQNFSGYVRQDFLKLYCLRDNKD